MNNNNMKFDPITGLPINHNNNKMPASEETQNINTNFQQPITNIQTQTTTENSFQNVEIGQQNSQSSIQQRIQNIPTVDQNKQEFIDNTQASSSAKKEEKKDGPNITLIIFLFVIIFAAIFFLFPYLQKTL